LKYIKTTLALILFCVFAISCYADENIKVDNLITADWGQQKGEFGLDKSGKTEIGYALDMLYINDNLYILDSVNNRIQIYDLNGKIINVIKLSIKWQDTGLPYEMAYGDEHFYFLIGKAPYYGLNGIREISKYSKDGIFVKSFGNKQIPSNKEDYFERTFYDQQNKVLISGLGGSKVLVFDSEGKYVKEAFKATKDEVIDLVGISPNGYPIIVASKSLGKIRKTILLDMKENKIIKEVTGRYSLADKNMNLYDVHTIRGSKRRNIVMTTNIVKYDAYNGSSSSYQLKGDIKLTRNGKEKLFRYQGNSTEKSVIAPNGDIYHLIALDDGVVVRKIKISK